MLDLSFVQIAPDTYQKWNHVLCIRTTIRFHGVGDNRKMTVRHEQPKQVISAILDRNVAIQNSFNGYKGKEMYQGTSLPIAVHSQVMKMCGHKPGQGYDEKKFVKIMNDIDYRKLKTIPGKL